MTFRSMTCALAFLLVSFITGADDTQSQDPLPVVEEVVVTAHPIIEGSVLTPLADKVTVVSGRQIDDLNAQDLTSALRRVPGLSISRYNLIGNYGGADGGSVFIRGQGSGRPGAEIGMLVDGVPRFVGIWTHPLMDVMSLDIADRIEVYKSAQPVMFGNMSFGAVNMVTKRMRHDGFTGRYRSSGGSYGTMVQELEHGGKIGGFDYYLSGSTRRSDGQRKNADGAVKSLNGRVGYRFGPSWDLSFQVNHADGDVDDPGQVGAAPKPIVEQFHTDDDLSIATLAHVYGPSSGTLKLYYDNGLIDWRQWDSAAPEQFNSVSNYDNYGIRYRETVSLDERSELIVGLDHDLYGGSFVEKRKSGDRSRKTITFRNTSPYVAVNRSFGNDTRIIPSLGFRYTMTRYFGNDWGGQAGVKFVGRNTEAYVNTARAFNLPGVYAAVSYDGPWSANGKNTGKWKSLDPERLTHLEAGAARSFGSVARVDVSVFRDRVTDALRFVSPPPPPPRFANTGAYSSKGIEASASILPIRNMDFFAGFSFARTDPDTIPNEPEFAVSLGLGYLVFDRIRISCDAEHSGKRYVYNPRFPGTATRMSSYTLVNLRLGYVFTVSGRVAGEPFIAVENLSDKSYSYRPGYPMPGRTFMVGLDVRM